MDIAVKPQESKDGETLPPLCVDMDGTLLRTDMLHEAVFLLLRLDLLYIFYLPFWLLKGKANLKAEIARRVAPNVENLPYNKTLLDWLLSEKVRGRKLVLATASHRDYAQAVAERVGLFDSVEASDDTTNLSDAKKAERLVHLFGENGFDYVGNSRADIPVWDRANRAIIVGNEVSALNYLGNEHAERLEEPTAQMPMWKVWLKAIRIHQWLKNLLLFVPVLLAARHFDFSLLIPLGMAFFTFSLCASSVYLLNDLIDIDVDRNHSSKRNRPIAAGKIPASRALIVSAIFLVAAFTLSLALLPQFFTLILAVYYSTTCVYSFYLKRKLLVDVLTLAGLFTIRVVAGSAAIQGGVSTWLLAFCLFFFLSLALVKRFIELNTQEGQEEGKKSGGRGYHPGDLETLAQSGIASGFAAIVVLALFIESPEVTTNFPRPEAIWLLLPLVLYLILRIWILARRKQVQDDPVIFLMTDWRSQIMIGAGATLLLGSQAF